LLVSKANRVIVILGLAAALLFAGGLLRLLVLRFQAGDIYPPYSSLRSDPLGARAFFDSLKRLPGLTVTRHFTGPRELGSEAATLILAGLGPGAMEGPQNDMAVLQRFVAGGGRAVLMLRAVKPRRPTDEDEPAVSQGKKGKAPAVKDDSTPETISIRTIDLQAEWAFRLETPPLGAIRPEAHRAPNGRTRPARGHRLAQRYGAGGRPCGLARALPGRRVAGDHGTSPGKGQHFGGHR
jgi:hypothetical protein